MIIYSDSFRDPKKITPAATYGGKKNFSGILELIDIGAIPCGTSKPFEVSEVDEENDLSDSPFKKSYDRNTAWGIK